MRRVGHVVAAVALLVGVTACGGDDDDFYGVLGTCREDLKADDPSASTLNDDNYRTSSGSFIVGDEGDSLLIDTNNSDTDITVLACVLDAIGATQALISNIDATTAMMGRQSEDVGGYHYEWSYHPDSGINMTITVQ